MGIGKKRIPNPILFPIVSLFLNPGGTYLLTSVSLQRAWHNPPASARIMSEEARFPCDSSPARGIMQTVTRFEANLLRLLYYFLGREPAERASRLVESRLSPPPCLSRPAVRLVQDALAKGCPERLARRGGWRVERHLRGEKAVQGRLWQRTAPADLGLKFSRHALELLIWLTASRPGDKEPDWQLREAELTPADLLLLFFVHEGLRGFAESLGAHKLRQRPGFARHGLCRLAYPEDFTEPGGPPDFAPWTTGLGACMLEALQPDLAARWVQVEGGKERITDPAKMLRLGQEQDRVLTAFLDAVEGAGRLDLARFLLRAAAELLGLYANAGMWAGSLQTDGLRLADRAATYAAALTFLRHLDRLRTWERRARTVGYFDEGYQASQLWKADWELYQGDQLHERAQVIIRQLDPMRQAN
jgi:hypothetical protein